MVKSKIVCLGWGSLIWDHRELKIKSEWFNDGPSLPVEFTRISNDQRVTLIIDRESKPIKTLWNQMIVNSLEEAKESLRAREGTIMNRIHHISANDDPNDDIQIAVRNWLVERELNSAIWTGLSYSAATNNLRPSIDFILEHIERLDTPERKVTFEYIKKAPEQIDTEYRKAMIDKFVFR